VLAKPSIGSIRAGAGCSEILPFVDPKGNRIVTGATHQTLSFLLISKTNLYSISAKISRTTVINRSSGKIEQVPFGYKICKNCLIKFP